MANDPKAEKHPRGTAPIDEDRYKGDFELLDRYQKFSEELLRLSLGGIAVVGFFIEKCKDEIVRSSKWTIIVALVGLALSAMGALVHRYYSADGMFHHLRAIRANALADKENADVKARNRRYWVSGWGLIASWVSLVIGAVGLGAAFVSILYQA